jgi:hypothetical protein
MNNLKTILDNLEDSRLDYVTARSRCKSTSEALRESGVNRNTFYGWDESERKHLDELAQRLKRETSARALMVLQDNTEKAARVMVGILDNRDPRLKLAASTEILDRTMGKNDQPVNGEINISVSIKKADGLQV